MRDRLEAGILDRVAGTVVNGTRDARVPNTTNISFDRIEAESLLIALDLEGRGGVDPSKKARRSSMPYLSIASRSMPQPKAKPCHSSGSSPQLAITRRMDHAGAEQLHPFFGTAEHSPALFHNGSRHRPRPTAR